MMGAAPLRPAETFAGFSFKSLDDVAPGEAIILSAAEASPYVEGTASHSANAPAAVRRASQKFSKQLTQLDFDLDGVLVGDGAPRCFDGGIIQTDSRQSEINRRRIQETTEAILTRGGKSLMLGGDDSVPIPWLAAYHAGGPYLVLQIDAHTDWGDEIQGNRYGYGSTMRRASEMAWVASMVQVGARGLGSGAAWQIDDARAWGSQIVTMKSIRQRGISAALDHVPEGAKLLVSVDCDGMDPALFPAVNMPTPGGLSYGQLVDLFTAIADRAEIVGAAIVEYVPERDDSQDLCALTAARLASLLLGLMVR